MPTASNSAMPHPRKKISVQEWAQSNFPKTFAALPSVDRMTFEGIELHDSQDGVKSSKVLWVGYHKDKTSNISEKHKIYASITDRYNRIRFSVKNPNSRVFTTLTWHDCQKIEFIYPFDVLHWRWDIVRIEALIRYYFEAAGHLKLDSATSCGTSKQIFREACAYIATSTQTNTRSRKDGDENEQNAKKGTQNEENGVAAQMKSQTKTSKRSNPNSRTMVSTESQRVGAGSSSKRRKLQHNSHSDEVDAKADALLKQIKTPYSAEKPQRAKKTQKLADKNQDLKERLKIANESEAALKIQLASALESEAALRAQLKSAKESEVSTKDQLTVAKVDCEALRKRAEKAENIAADAEETTRKIREQVKQLFQL